MAGGSTVHRRFPDSLFIRAVFLFQKIFLKYKTYRTEPVSDKQEPEIPGRKEDRKYGRFPNRATDRPYSGLCFMET